MSDDNNGEAMHLDDKEDQAPVSTAQLAGRLVHNDPHNSVSPQVNAGTFDIFAHLNVLDDDNVDDLNQE